MIRAPKKGSDMQELINLVKNIQKDKEIVSKISSRILSFKELNSKGNKEWFSELCFCILTANSKAETAIRIQNELGYTGFISFDKEQISKAIRQNKHRFHNTKANYIIQARKFSNIKDLLPSNELNAREWLSENVNGLGLKESSHFLRNVGYKNLAILDRHVLNILFEFKLIKKIPNLSLKNYLFLEEILSKLCKKTDLSQAELDMYLWYSKTSKVLK